MDPRKLILPIFIVVLAAAGYAGYRYLNQPTQQADDFLAVLNLTPGSLLMNCGQPAFTSVGVVGDSAGVQDMHYKPSEQDEIVFRFITEDDKHWISLGAWERVNAVDALGVPVSASVAVRRQPCAGKLNDQSKVELQPNSWSMELAAALNPVGLAELAALEEQPQQTPWVVQAPSDGFLLPPPHANPYDNGGDSGIVRTYTPCPPNAPSCLVVSYAEFNDGMGRVIRSEQNDDFRAAVDRLTRHGTVVVRLPTGGDERDAAINGVVKLEVKSINIIAVRLRDDIVHLTPTDRDSGQIKTQKLAALMHDEQVRKVLWKQAVASNRPSPKVTAGGPHAVNTLAFNTKALERMVQIHETGVWP